MGQVSILDGSTFVVSDEDGEISPDGVGPQGLVYRDVRHLSRWQLRINDRALDALAGDVTDYHSAVFYLVEPTGSVYRSPPATLIRRRRVGEGVIENLSVHNHHTRPLSLRLTIMFAADFADLFEVKDGRPGRRETTVSVNHDRVTLEYRRAGFTRRTVIRAKGAVLSEESLVFEITVAPGGAWRTEIEIRVVAGGHEAAPKRDHHPNIEQSLREWLDAAPRLETDWEDLRHAYRRSLLDLAALRFYPDVTPRASVPAAGLPWYMALLGRDSLITSYQALPFAPELARTTLRALVQRQAHDFDEFRDAEPDKIMHELRHGELAYLGQRPQSPYYGSADATPLFLIVLDEYERWTGDTALVRELEAPARAALKWVRESGDLNEDGFIWYATRNPDTGMANQCWKDSDNSIVYPDGRLAPLPRATCEIQGYAYDARRRTARLAREIWHDEDLAAALDGEADRLRDRFDEVFWLPERGYYALALDGDGQPVPTLASNMGQLLWTGIVPAHRVAPVVARLFSRQMFSGWGIRTLGTGQPAYNPVEYHNGTVWPHDNSLIATGLARYGRRNEAARIATALLDAARFFDHRLPEVFAGADRAATTVPIRYPTACSPQAWASGTPLLLIRAILGLAPTADRLDVDPHLPDGVQRLTLQRVPGRWGHADAVAERH